jgi:hypothetical protein
LVVIALKLLMSGAPDLEEEVEQNECQSSPNRQNYFLTIVPDDWHIIRDTWIAIEKLVSLAKNEDSGTQKAEKTYAENHLQGGNAGLLNDRHEPHYLASD